MNNALLPGNYSEVGYSPPPEMEYDEYERAVAALRSFHRSVLWALGDLLNFGEGKFGESYAQVVEGTDYDLDTLTRAQRLSRTFPPERRRRELSWGHHREVVDLPPAKQEVLLDHAVWEHLSCHALRGLRRQLQGTGTKLPVEVEAMLRSAPREAQSLYTSGMEDGDIAVWTRDVTVVREQRWVRATVTVRMEDVGGTHGDVS